MSKEIIVWKVVTEARESAIIIGEMTVKYNKGKVTKPKDRRFPLYAFKTFDAAFQFKDANSSFANTLMVIKCKAIKSRSKSNTFIQLSYYWVKTLLTKDFILKRIKQRNTVVLVYTKFPETVKCSSITPLE
jgi:hypothetical protein